MAAKFVIEAHADNFIKGIKKSIEVLEKFRTFLPHLANIEKAFGNVKRTGVAPLEQAIAQLEVVARRNKLVFKSAKPEIDKISEAYKKFAKSVDTSNVELKKIIKTLRVASAEQGKIPTATQVMGKKEGGLFSGGGEFGSAQWMTQRAVWFAQLRATWAAYQGVTTAFKDVVTFNQAMANLRAITGDTAEEVQLMEDAIRDASVATKFFAADAANAAVKLAQAGFNAKEVAHMMEPIAVLASATNRELDQTADAVRIVIRGFGLGADQASKVVNVLAAGVKNSAIQIEDMNQGFQHFITTAKQFGWSVEDLVAWMGVLRNVGFKAGTAMTALRQITKVLTDGTPELEKMLQSVGLTFEDVSLRTHTFEEAMKKMNEKQLTAADIFSVVRVRAAGVLTATRDLVTQQELLKERLTGTNAAWEMAKEQMTGVENRWKRIKSIFQEIIVAITAGGKILEPFVWLLEKTIQLFGLWIVNLAAFFEQAYLRLKKYYMLFKTIFDVETKAILSRATAAFVGFLKGFFKDGIIKGIKDAIKAGFDIKPEDIKGFFATLLSELKKTWDKAKKESKLAYENLSKAQKRIVAKVPGGPIDLAPGETGGGKPPGGIIPVKSNIEELKEFAEQTKIFKKEGLEYHKESLDSAKEIIAAEKSLIESMRRRGQLQGEIRAATVKFDKELIDKMKTYQLSYEEIVKRERERIKLLTKRQYILDQIKEQEIIAESPLGKDFGESAEKAKQQLEELKLSLRLVNIEIENFGNTLLSNSLALKEFAEQTKMFRDAMKELNDESLKEARKEIRAEDDVVKIKNKRLDLAHKIKQIGIKSAEEEKIVEMEGISTRIEQINNLIAHYEKVRETPTEFDIPTEEVEANLSELNTELTLTAAQLKELKRLASRGFGEAFTDGIKKATAATGTWADITEEAGKSIFNITKDTIASGLNELGDSLATGESNWKDWAKSAITALRNVATQLFALWVMKSAFGGLFGRGGVTPEIKGGTALARGGVVPNFRRFAGGGMTSGPAFALLGDNPSKKELVIPSENIHKDSVSGYTREKESKGDIAILNVVDPSMMVSMMGSMQGKQIIINAINEDVLRRGPSYSVVRGVR